MPEFKYDKKRRQICPLSGGKDSTAMAIFLKDKIPNLEYVFVIQAANCRKLMNIWTNWKPF